MNAQKANKTKVFLLFGAVLFFSIQFAELSAQSLFVRNNAGSQTEYTISEIAKLTFSSGDFILEEKNGSANTYLITDIRYINFDNLIGINQNLYTNEEFCLYPNPANNILNVKLDVSLPLPSCFNLEIFTIDGKLVQSENVYLQFGENKLSIDISALPKGFYICMLKGDEMIKTRKLIKL